MNISSNIARSGALFIAATMGGFAAPVQAQFVFADTFDDPAFNGNSIRPGTNDRFSTVDYYRAANFGGWDFTGDAFLVRSASGDAGVVLNETSNPGASATRTVTGLTGAGARRRRAAAATGTTLPAAA